MFLTLVAFSLLNMCVFLLALLLPLCFVKRQTWGHLLCQSAFVFIGVLLAIVCCKKAAVIIWTFTFASQLLFSSFYGIFGIRIGVCFSLAGVFFVSIDFGLYLILVLYLRGTFSVWCTFCFSMHVLFSFPLFLNYDAGRCTLHATTVGRRRWEGLQLVKLFLPLRAFFF